jgi:hypothetical protein
MKLARFTLALSLLVPLSASAQERPRHRRHRDRFTNTISVGGTLVAGSPLGVAGAFLEYRPVRWVSASVGGGFGGTFGPAVAATLYVDPVVTRVWALGVAGSISHNFSYVHGEVMPGRPPLPDGTNWVSVELQTQLRPSRGWFIRLGVGYAFLLNTSDFHIASESELGQVSLPSFPVASPVDAVRAAARGDTFGTWFVHLDFAPAWRL